MNDVDETLRRAPREASPGRDLWPAISAGIRPARAWPPVMRAAAAITIFLAGGAAGAAMSSAGLLPPREPQTPTAESLRALHAVIAVQRAGSDYLAALGRLRHLDSEQQAMRSQGYEAAVSVLTAAAWEVSAAADLPGGTSTLTQSADQVRGAAAARVSRLHPGSLR